jgi:hypothetical protein
VSDTITAEKITLSTKFSLLAGPAGKVLYRGLRSAGSKILGTPQSFRSLRSKVMAATTIFGPYTCQINLCPNEYTSKWVFEMAGEKYDLDTEGNPLLERHIEQCTRLVAMNPTAVSTKS